MRWRAILGLLRTRFVGTVTAKTTLLQKGEPMPGGAMIGRYILTEHPLFGRRAKLIGDPGESAAANDKHARVVAWLHGGPLPPLDEDTRQKAPAPVLRLVEPPR